MPIKLLYAASNRTGAKVQCSRILEHLDPTHYTIKLAGYYKMGMSLDWTLDAMLDMFNPQHISLNNDNFEIFFQQVKLFDPDLIISDLEIFSSSVGQLLHKPVWQVSPQLLECITTETQFGKHKYGLLYQHSVPHQELLNNILLNADRKYIYSHFGDANVVSLTLPDTYQWLRPYYYQGATPLTQYKTVGILLNQNINDPESIIFKYPLDNILDYVNTIQGATYCLTTGLTDILADYFYNNKFAIIMPDFYDAECMLNMLLSESAKTGKACYNANYLQITPPSMVIKIKSEIPFLHTEINNFFGV